MLQRKTSYCYPTTWTQDKLPLKFFIFIGQCVSFLKIHLLILHPNITPCPSSTPSHRSYHHSALLLISEQGEPHPGYHLTLAHHVTAGLDLSSPTRPDKTIQLGELYLLPDNRFRESPTPVFREPTCKATHLLHVCMWRRGGQVQPVLALCLVVQSL